MSKLMISVSGIRGIFGETLTPDNVLRYAAHFGKFVGGGKIIVGRDSRVTGPIMYHAIVAGLTSVGCDVVNIGIASTPTVLLAVEESDANGGIAITASHNPAQWNAMKFVDKNGMFLIPEKADKFIKMLDNKPLFVDWDKTGKIFEDLNATERHIKKILQIPYIDVDKIRSKKYKVVIDSVNGAGGLISPKLLKELGCDVIEINSEPTGIFAHTPEPLNKNLIQLEQAVKDTGADIGFATDPDVDRLAIVSEKGMAIGEEFSLLLAEDFVLQHKKGDIVTNLSSSMASEDLAKKYGVNVHRTKVGEINVGKKMKEVNAAIGGEGNGGIICPEVHYTRDAPVGMALILAYMANTDSKISDLVNEIPRYYFAKDKITVEPSLLDTIIQKVPELFANYKIDNTDGYKILGDKFWIHIRKSGTEPIIRVYTESESEEKSKKLCDDTIKKLLQK
jgi:phosphomannomutase